jgi:hypothetical protein
MKILTLVLVLISVTAGCGTLTPKGERPSLSGVHEDRTPEALRPVAKAMDMEMVVAPLAVAAGVALMIFMPMDSVLGLTIIASSIAMGMIAMMTRVTLSHPWVLAASIILTITGIACWAWERLHTQSLSQDFTEVKTEASAGIAMIEKAA